MKATGAIGDDPRKRHPCYQIKTVLLTLDTLDAFSNLRQEALEVNWKVMANNLSSRPINFAYWALITLAGDRPEPSSRITGKGYRKK